MIKRRNNLLKFDFKSFYYAIRLKKDKCISGCPFNGERVALKKSINFYWYWDSIIPNNIFRTLKIKNSNLEPKL